MKKWRKRLIKTSVLGLILACAGALSASAAVTEGKPGETVAGDYAVIVNTSTTDAQSTGTLVFDESGNGVSTVRAVSAADPVGQDVQAAAAAPYALTSAASVSYHVGAEKYISRANGDGKTYVCIGEGSHCYIWMEKTLKSGYDAAGKTSVIAEDMAQTYDGRPFEILSQMAGGTIPCQDGSGKLSILLETLTGASGVFRSDVGITAIHINTPAASAYQKGEMSACNGLLAHEGQHALFHLLAKCDTKEPYLWLNEGISVAVMDYLWGGTDSRGWMDGIAGNADIRNGSSLFYREYRDSTARDYGMPYLFVRYLIARAAGGYKPMQLFPQFYKTGADCSPGVYLQKVLAQAGRQVSFSDLLTQFYTAIIAQESSGVYGFAGDPIVRQKVSNYPLYKGESGRARTLAPTAAIMLRLENGVFQVPEDGGDSIRYMIVSGERNVPVPKGGDGSAAHPYEISDFEDLALIGNKPGAHYKLTQDIEADGQNLTVPYFSGVLDGAGHVIRGLSMPLIGRNSGTIQNLTIEAALDGEFMGAQGVFTQVNSGLIRDCTAAGMADLRLLRGKNSFVYPVFGAFAGENEVAGTIQNCGTCADIRLTLPAATGWIGGIAGTQTGVVKNCYSRGRIAVAQPNDECEVYVGGLAGKLAHMGMGGILNCCIHTGTIEVTGGKAHIGQLCGHADSSVMNSGLENYIKFCRIKKGNGPAVGYAQEPLPQDLDSSASLTEEQIKDKASYEGWDFGSDWKMGESGPEHLASSDIESLQVADAQTTCYIGEEPYSWGRVVVNGVKGAKVTADMVSGFDSRTEGEKTVKVTYLGRETTYQIQVKKPQSVTDLRVSSVAKTKYANGESFDLSGVKLIATIDGNPSRILTGGFDCDKKTPLTAADTSVTFTYFGASVTYSPITVAEKAPSSLTILSNMGTTLYLAGQKLDLSDVRAQINYNNGESTPTFGMDQFDVYGIRVVKKLSDSCKVVQPGATLQLSDNNAAIWLCANDLMPGTSGTVSKQIGTLTVKEPLHISETTLHMAQGQADQWLVTHMEGGSGDSSSRNYATTVVREELPDGVTRTKLPDSSYTYFEYRGMPTGQAGSYTSTYLVKDTGTGEGLTVELTIEVHPSNEAQFFSFDLLASQNAALSEDVTGLIGENEIVLRVPKGTDVTALQPAIDYGSGMGTTVPQAYWNGTKHDFTNPVVYTLTAPDGRTKKSYTVTVEFYDPDGGASGGSGSEGEPGGSGSEGEPGGSGSEGKPGGSGSEERPGGSGSEEEPGGSGTEGEPGGSGNEENPGGGSDEKTENQGGNSGENTESDSDSREESGSVGADSGDTDKSNGAGSAGGSPSPTNPEGAGARPDDNQTPDNVGGTNASPGDSMAPGNTATNEGRKPGTSSEQAASAAYPAVGTQIVQGGISYRITSSSSSSCTAELYRPVNKKKASIRMAATVRAGGYTYKVTSIAAKAFRNNRYLKKITIGKYVTSIGNQAFYGCKSLKTLTVPAAVKTIGNQAFARCTALAKAVIGKSVQTVGAKAFYGCRKLKQITVKSTVLKKVKSGAFKGIHPKATIHVPKKKRAAYRKLFKRKVF